MTNERLAELIEIKAELDTLESDISELERYDMYNCLSIIGRMQGETLSSADTLCMLSDHPGLIEVIIQFLKKRRDELAKTFEEA